MVASQLGAGPVKDMTSRSLRYQAALGAGLNFLFTSQCEISPPSPKRLMSRVNTSGTKSPQVRGLGRYRERQGLGLRSPGQHLLHHPPPQLLKTSSRPRSREGNCALTYLCSGPIWGQSQKGTPLALECSAYPQRAWPLKRSLSQPTHSSHPLKQWIQDK